VNENERHRLSIARELMTWADAMPRLIQRVDEVACSPTLTDAQAVYIESITERLGDLLQTIRAAVASDECDECLIAGVDDLRREITTASDTLDRILKPSS
jgi:hypothetical protein